MRRHDGNARWIVGLALATALAWGATPAGERSAQTSPEDDDRIRREVQWLLVDDDHEHAGAAYLGVRVTEEVERAEGGARVESVLPDSPAEDAGVRDGDIIVELDGTKIHGPLALTTRLREHDPGERVALKLLRDGKPVELEVELGERSFGWGGLLGGDEDDPYVFHWNPEDFQKKMAGLQERLQEIQVPELRGLSSGLLGFANRPKLGVELVEVTPELREHLGGDPESGVLVAKLLPGMPAQSAGILVGDLIVAVDGEAVEDSGDLVRELAGKDGRTIEIELIRDGRKRSIEVVIPEREPAERPSGPRA